MLLGLVSGLCLHIIFNIMITVLPIQIDNEGVSSKKTKKSAHPAYPRLKVKNVRYRGENINFNSHNRDLQSIRTTKATSPQQNLFRQVILEEESFDMIS